MTARSPWLWPAVRSLGLPARWPGLLRLVGVEEAFMRGVWIAAITFAALSLFSVEGAAAPWCAEYSGGGNGNGGGSNCGFYSFEQCLATVRGIGGFCSRNPFELGSAGSAYGYATGPRKRHRR
jgi:hypothetical protein